MIQLSAPPQDHIAVAKRNLDSALIAMAESNTRINPHQRLGFLLQANGFLHRAMGQLETAYPLNVPFDPYNNNIPQIVQSLGEAAFIANLKLHEMLNSFMQTFVGKRRS